MKQLLRHRKLSILLFTLLLLLISLPVFALSGGEFDLPWSSIDGGGGLSSGGDFSLFGTAGQPDAGTLAGGDFTLSGGFVGGGEITPSQYDIFLPLIMK